VSPGMVNPATLRHVRDVALPCATDHGIELHELRKVRRDGSIETPHGRLVQPGSRSLPILVRTSDTGAPGTRSSKAPHWHFQESLEAIRARGARRKVTASDPSACPPRAVRPWSRATSTKRSA
jgi:hypothetical protein